MSEVIEELKFPFSRAGSPLDPPAQYQWLRKEQPAAKVRMWDGREAWILTRWNDVKEILSHPSFSANPLTPGYPFLTAARKATVTSYQTFITLDPPQHGHFRRMLTRDFTQKRMEELRPKIEAYVEALFDEMEAHGSPADFVKFVALKLPVTVVSLLIGVPYEDHENLVKWSADKLDLTLDPAITQQASKHMFDYFDNLLAEKERNPGEGSDMLGRLVREQIRPGNLDRYDALHMLMLLYFAGHETTANQLGLGTLSLLLDPQQKDALRDNPELVKNAVEEMLRFYTPPHLNACRVAIDDVEIAGVTIQKGEGVYPLLLAANRDPEIFDSPDEFDIRRENADQHIAFSNGIHQCLGQPLARLELQVVFSKLFQRFPSLQLAEPLDSLPFKHDMYVFGLHALPVSW